MSISSPSHYLHEKYVVWLYQNYTSFELHISAVLEILPNSLQLELG